MTESFDKPEILRKTFKMFWWSSGQRWSGCWPTHWLWGKLVRALRNTVCTGLRKDGMATVGTGILAPQWHLFGFISGFALPRKQPVLHGQRDRALGCAWPRLDVLGPVNGLSVLHLLWLGDYMRHTEIFVLLNSENLEVKGLILPCPTFCVLEKTSKSHASYLKSMPALFFETWILLHWPLGSNRCLNIPCAQCRRYLDVTEVHGVPNNVMAIMKAKNRSVHLAIKRHGLLQTMLI